MSNYSILCFNPFLYIYRYDFDNDKYITPEDIRIMISYMPFQRNIQLVAAQKQIELLNGASSPVRGHPQRQRVREGLY